MNFDIDNRTILRVRHGSQAYGTSTPESDLDVKGVCIEPIAQQIGFLHSFEQHERMANKGHDCDLVIFSLKKFAKLAAECNPNIIEILFVDDSDVMFIDEYGEELRSHRNDFLSKKARFTFSGYGHAQLKRIKTHRAWLLNPPKNAPSRVDFGLQERSSISKTDLGAFEALGDEATLLLNSNVVDVFTREKRYQAAKKHWDQYNTWLHERNPTRAALEAKHGYDTKHAGHLIRLMRMCREILETGQVLVRRPDAEELLAIRRGKWEYERVIEEAEKLDALCGELYKTSTLRNEPDRVALDKLVTSMTMRYELEHGEDMFEVDRIFTQKPDGPALRILKEGQVPPKP